MRSNIIIGFLFIVFCIKAENYSAVIDKIQKYQSGVRIIRSDKDDYLDPQTFNRDTYFAFFDKLEFDKSKIFDVYYFDNYLDGNPYLYAIDSIKDFDYSVKEYSLHQKLSSTKRALSKSIIFKFLNDSTSWARSYVFPDDSDFGYLQYLYFAKMGEKFALKWHSLRRSMQVICSVEDFMEYLKKYRSDTLYHVEMVKQVDMQNSKIEPRVRIERDRCIITWIEQREYSICECTYEIESRKPYRIKELQTDWLYDIHSNFIY